MNNGYSPDLKIFTPKNVGVKVKVRVLGVIPNTVRSG